jgi:hypothetical protein
MRLKTQNSTFTLSKWLDDQDEERVVGKVRAVWAAILKTEVAADTDFFGAGAGSMDVVRLV